MKCSAGNTLLRPVFGKRTRVVGVMQTYRYHTTMCWSMPMIEHFGQLRATCCREPRLSLGDSRIPTMIHEGRGDKEMMVRQKAAQKNSDLKSIFLLGES